MILRDLALGLRLAVTGGSGPRLRAVLTAVGVALGVALLLAASSVPNIVDQFDAKRDARAQVYTARPDQATMRWAFADTNFEGRGIRGDALQQLRPGAVPPPGIPRLPRPGEMYVSPALAKLLHDEPLLRERLPARIAGTITHAGLDSPADAAFVLGSDRLRDDPRAQDIRGWGAHHEHQPLGVFLTLLVIVMVVALLVPVGVFVGVAVRFGGEDRDRRLAALRLVGASRSTARLVAAGETLLGALAGLAAGALLFWLGRPLAGHVTVSGLAVYPEYLRPGGALAALVAVLVPAMAVGATLVSLRGAVIEPLGVSRRGRPPRRRIAWRTIPTVLGVGCLWSLAGNGRQLSSTSGQFLASAGVLLILVGVVTLLPWAVESVVRRAPTGPLSVQLAVRRLQLDAGTTGRVVSGIAVAVAGAIALQTSFAAASREGTVSTGVNVDEANMVVRTTVAPGRLDATLRRTPGVERSVAVTRVDTGDDRFLQAYIADCATIRRATGVARCRDGDAFLPAGAGALARGVKVHLGIGDDGRRGPVVRVPGDAQQLSLPVGSGGDALVLTPALVRGRRLPGALTQAYVLFGDRADAADQVRTAVLKLDPLADASRLTDTIEPTQLASLRRALFLGAVAVLLMIGAALLVAAIEQLRERRRVLAVLAAFGTRRRTMALSVAWQTAVPMVLGLLLAIATGLVLAVLLLGIVGADVIIDWGATAGLAGAGALVVIGVTVLSLPVLHRLMRPDALRVE